jgi:hypothetical protein
MTHRTPLMLAIESSSLLLGSLCTIWACGELLLKGAAHFLLHGAWHADCPQCWRAAAEKLMRRQVDSIIPRRVRG